MKYRTKLLILFIFMLLLVGTTSCEQGTTNPGTDDPKQPTHVVTNLDVPANLNVLVGETEVEISFDFVENASMYEVIIEKIGSTEIIKEKISPLLNKTVKSISLFTNGSYSAKVRAIGDDGEKYYNSAYSSKVNFTISNGASTATKLTTPSIVSTSLNASGLTVTYNEVENASGYQVVVRDVDGVIVASKEVKADVNSVVFETISFEEAQYFINVIAKGDNKHYLDSNPSSAEMLDIYEITNLSAPTNVTITNDTESVIVKYNKVSNAQAYQIVVKDSSGNITVTKDVANSVSSQEINVSAFKDGDYTVVVIAKGDDVKFITSDASASASFKVKSGKPDTGQSDDPTQFIAYYKGVEGLVGSALKAKLRSIITTTHKHTTTYAELKSVLQNADQDPNNSANMLLYYTGVSIKKTDDMNIWNREHVWAQSLGWFKTSGAGADAHHLRPCNPSVNSSRGNKKFGTASGYYNPYNVNGSGQDYRGDTARIIFYLFTRYSQSDSYGFTAIAQSLDLLLEWNKIDPVTPHEEHRNEVVYAFQGNRNPFIDYPEFADMIWK